MEYATLYYVAVAVAFVGLSMGLRYLGNRLSGKRKIRDDLGSRDRLIATLRLRLPPNAEMVVLEHQMYFRDERNRVAAGDVFTKNGFSVTTTETFEKATRYWLLAARTAMIDRVPEELQRVHSFTASYGGHFVSCNPRI
jgi:hypothetical protein